MSTPYIERLTHRSLHDHKVNTGGIITVTDSSWMLSFAVHRQPHFKEQTENQTTVWIYGLYSDTEGDYVRKRITECTGEEITQEWLYHLGVPPESLIPRPRPSGVDQHQPGVHAVHHLVLHAAQARRSAGRRPSGSRNLAFIGNFAESPTRDTVFTTEYSVRTAMEAVYTLLDVDRGVPEVFGSAYDIRELLNAAYYLRDRRSLAEEPLPTKLPVPGFLRTKALKKLEGTWLEELLKGSHLL